MQVGFEFPMLLEHIRAGREVGWGGGGGEKGRLCVVCRIGEENRMACRSEDGRNCSISPYLHGGGWFLCADWMVLNNNYMFPLRRPGVHPDHLDGA
jgi:hypothetical protein